MDLYTITVTHNKYYDLKKYLFLKKIIILINNLRAMINGLYFYKLVSKYPEDQTLNCKLSINQIDSNFETLKDADISAATFVREDKTLVLTRNNGEKLVVVLDDVTYNLEIDKECGKSGTTLTFSFDGKDGKENVVVPNILTADNLIDVIGSDILTKVITDGTLRGHGTLDAPLGINGVEKTGSLAPVLEVFDLTEGGSLPEVAKLGTRYITKEYVNDYGYLYNGNGVNKIQQKLDELYIGKNTKENKRYAWRIPTKDDWDALLNSLEPCEYQNHGSAKCHVELGKLAGKYLKSECGWVNQPDCQCTPTKPNTGCTYPDVDVDEQLIPHYEQESPIGVDKYGMTILPSGFATLDTFGRPGTYGFREQSMFWSATHVNSDLDQDVYVKIFDWNKGGVTQAAECPKPYYSVRLVKDYDGSNFYDSEYIDGILYKTILFPKSGQIWLASNYADKEGFVEYQEGGETPDLLEVNNGNVLEKRTEFFVNEWNGNYWDKKIMKEGETVVIKDPSFDQSTGSTTEVCWLDLEGIRNCVEIEIPKSSQSNLEYRVFTEDDSCNKTLVNSDDLVVERVVQIIAPMIEHERDERIEADDIINERIDEEVSAITEVLEALDEKIDAETERAFSAETELDEKIDEETTRAISSEAELDEKIDAETERAFSAETELNEKIEAETERAFSAETELNEKIEAEENARESADTEILETIGELASRTASAITELWNALEDETNEREAADEDLQNKIEAETARATDAENALQEAITAEEARAISAETALDEKLDEEIARAKTTEDEISGLTINTDIEYTLSASASTENLILESKDGNEDHFIKIKFDGNFGTIQF
jgi:hypothetical protein